MIGSRLILRVMLLFGTVTVWKCYCWKLLLFGTVTVSRPVSGWNCYCLELLLFGAVTVWNCYCWTCYCKLVHLYALQAICTKYVKKL